MKLICPESQKRVSLKCGSIDSGSVVAVALSGALAVILIVWLCASWYFIDLAHGLLFGRQRHERHHEDLRAPELASLAIVLVLLVALGVMPSHLFDPEPANLQRTVGMEFPAWIK